MVIVSLPGDSGQKSCTRWLAPSWRDGLSVWDLPPTEAAFCGSSAHCQGSAHGGSLGRKCCLGKPPEWRAVGGGKGNMHVGKYPYKKSWKTELRFVDGINMKQRPLEKIILKRNEKYIKLCLIYGIYRLLTSKYKVLFPWSSLSLMYYLSVNVVHSEHNSYGNISVPTAALLHPWNSVIFKFPHC